MIRIISKAAAGHSHAVQKSCFVFKDNFLSIYKRESEYRTQLKILNSICGIIFLP